MASREELASVEEERKGMGVGWADLSLALGEVGTKEAIPSVSALMGRSGGSCLAGSVRGCISPQRSLCCQLQAGWSMFQIWKGSSAS